MKARPSLSSHVLRSLESVGDYRACVALQEEVWGAGFSERVPMAILKVGQRLGGVSAGAFREDGPLEGFVFGLTGLDRDGSVVHWSDMLAVRPDAQGRGLAVRLKAHQRDVLLERGVRRMLWTFDPLRARNAHLNLNKLGAVVGEYRRDMYGETDSALHRGIGTDRFVALWRLDSARVRERLARALGRATGAGVPDGAPSAGPSVLDARRPGRDPGPEPGEPRLGLDDPWLSVAVPADIGALISEDVVLAADWREATREVFVHYLDRGYEVRELSREGEGTGCVSYLMRREAPTASAQDGSSDVAAGAPPDGDDA